MNKNKGFTLIELLVVIAIIGILSSVVLASLNTARGKGADTAIKQQLATIRPQAEIYYDTNGSYGATVATTTTGTSGAACASTGLFADTTIQNQLKGVSSNAGTASVAGVSGARVICGSTGTAWTVAAVLKSDATQMWCVDSSGASKQITVASTGSSLSAWQGCQ